MPLEPPGPSIVVLGHVSVPRGSAPLTRQDRHLLALLTVHHGQILGADEIIGVLWPEAPPHSARNRVQWLISSLRRALPSDAIDSNRSGYRLAVDPSLIDAAVFTDLARSADPSVLESALGLWHGPAYQEIGLPVVVLEAQRLNEMRLNVKERLLKSRLEAGQHLSVLPELRHLVAEYPLRQRFRAQLMLALYRGGQQAEALEAYRLGATLLAADHGLDPSPELQRLQQQILRDDPVLVDEPVVVGPMQLPPAAQHIVGRDELRSDLAERLRQPPEPGTATIVALYGMGGVGKTTLATRVGHDVRADFPAGILFTDLHGMDAGAADRVVSASTVLNGFLRALGVSGEAIPADLPARQALYRSVLDGRRVLLVLDNAHSEEQVRPLLPGAGGVALVTSRRLLAGLVDATHVCVEPLDADAGLRLLQQTAGARAGEQPGAAAEITNLCGGLPLAIRIAGIRLREQRSLSATTLRDRLADERQRLDELSAGDLDLRAVMAIERHRLVPEQLETLSGLSRLALHTVTAGNVVSLLGCSPQQAQRHLERLETGALLVPHSVPGRYHLHDMIRLVSREHPMSQPLDQAAQRVYRDLLQRALAANASLPCRAYPLTDPIAPAPSREEAVSFFELELDNLIRAARHAHELGFGQLAVELATSVTNFCLMRSLHDQWQDSIGFLCGGQPPPMVALSQGNLLRLRDRNREALPVLRSAYRDFVAAQDNWRAATALLQWGVAIRELGRLSASRAALDKAWAMLPGGSGSRLAEGYFWLLRYQLDGAKQALTQALEIFTEAGETWAEAETRLLRADTEEELDRVIGLYTSLGDRLNASVAELMKARVLHAAKRDAEPLLRKVFAGAEQLHHSWLRSAVRRQLAALHLERGEPEQAKRLATEAAHIMRERGMLMFWAISQRLLAEALAALGDHGEARKVAQEALEVLDEQRLDLAADLRKWIDDLPPDA